MSARGGQVDAAAVWEALAAIPDPELPPLSLVDLGVITHVEVRDGRALVRFTPTFVGCPAVEPMRRAIREAVAGLGLEAAVETSYEEPWTSDRISAAGRAKLAAAGISPPGPAPPAPLTLAHRLTPPPRAAAECPVCGSRETRLENAFGPTPCRSLWYCDGCGQPFEAFKPV